VIALVLASILSFRPAGADAGFGVNSGEELTLMTHARTAAMAPSAATGGGNGGIESNPASLAAEDSTGITGTVAQMAGNMRMESISAVLPTAAVTLALSGWLFQSGTIRMVDSAGSGGTVEAQSDMVAVVGAGRPIGSGFSAGLAAKWFRSVMVERQTADSFTADGGLTWRDRRGILAVGAAFRNAGRDLYNPGPAGLRPISFVTGVCWKFVSRRTVDAVVAVDYSAMRGIAPETAIGVEVKLMKRLSIRAGLRGVTGMFQPSLGLGFAAGRFVVDLASVAPSGALPAHRASLTVLI
jgi:hypothetical protein